MRKLLLACLLLAGTVAFAQDANFHIYLCLGQSNMEGNAKIEPQDTVAVDDRFQMMAAVDCLDLGRVKGHWYKAVPPLARCHTGLTPGDYFGRTPVAALPANVRVGIINVAIGGCKIELFDKDNYPSYVETAPDWMKNMIKEYDGNPYGRLVEMARLAQKDGVIKGILLHQGESNTHDKEWPLKVKGVYESLLKDLGLSAAEVPLVAGEVVHADQKGVCAGMNSIINTLPEVIPTAHVISSAGCPAAGDNLHFTAEGYRMLGARYAARMLSILGYGAEGTFYTDRYPNLFTEYLEISRQQTDERIMRIWEHFFVNEDTKVYYECDDNTAYIYDTGNRDVRTEGMSYGMMICVQLDKQAEFDKLWRWAKKHMLYTSGKWKGYYAWHCRTNGEIIGKEPSCASDGEIYFITSLFFAAHRWGNGGAYDYEKEAQQLLKDVMSKDGTGEVYNLFNMESKLVTFVPEKFFYNYTDPSYNLSAFFELWALWSDTNKEFWRQTPDASRNLLADASHPETGLFADYSAFDGTPWKPEGWGYDTRRYQYDAIRCAMNVGMDYYWFGKDAARQEKMMSRLLNFFKEDGFKHEYFNWDGSEPAGNYSTGMTGANAVGAFALKDKELARKYVRDLWEEPMPTGRFRYYSGMVYMLSMLHVSGNFRIIK